MADPVAEEAVQAPARAAQVAVFEDTSPTGEILLEEPEASPTTPASTDVAADGGPPVRLQPAAPLWSATGTLGVTLSDGADAAPPAVSEPAAEEDIGLLAEAALYLPAEESEEDGAPTIVHIERRRGLVPGSYWDMSNRYVPPAPDVEEGVVPRPLEGTYWDRAERVLSQTTEQPADEDTRLQEGGYWDRSSIRR